MQKADLTTRAVAGFVDLLIVVGLSRLPDVLGFLSACGYLLMRDGLFQGRSAGKKHEEDGTRTAAYRESIIRNVPFAAAYILFLVPYAGWVLGPAVLAIECLVAIGDDRGMRTGDMLANTFVSQTGPAPSKAGREEEPHPKNLPAETGEKLDQLP
jgi:hypothetical protein